MRRTRPRPSYVVCGVPVKGTKCKRPYGHSGECNPNRSAIPYKAEQRVIALTLDWRRLDLRSPESMRTASALHVLGVAVDIYNRAMNDARLICAHDLARFRKRSRSARKAARTRKTRAAAARDRGNG